ncbi:ATPase family associated with various cellular activities (AAA) domain-containing protein [Trichoderma breve]|uniref:ATPase family associated with various cellular activities (AAA) domain-containing protein n=1 Tax=Trichoderma breve TaxID=2034170 RepID=A0A9W9B8G0_9HYPO|nr:ATPase family associated with various cellular activities (AAA) domain-containing protein [Trichoderma breve]KAJ4858548.1 ATPase family associated with various cellular activities (AAA) domain-containing protein [Trichoderma breve]
MVPLTVRLSTRIPRAIHTSAIHLNNRSGGNGVQPAEDAIDNNDETEYQPGTETSGGRWRGNTTGSMRARQQRRRQVSALPPVELHQSFLRNNVSHYSPQEPPRLPIALAEDAKHPKVSPLSIDQGPSIKQKSEALEMYFEAALKHLLARGHELAVDLEKSRLDKDDRRWDSPEIVARAVRVGDMTVDSVMHLINAIYPTRVSEYSYQVRPFWWSHVPKILNSGLPGYRDQLSSLVASLDDQLDFAEQYEYPLPHVIADLPVDTFVALRKLVSRELLASPPPTFDYKTSKRPITILAVSGYGGKSISEAIGKYFAHYSGADLIQLDAYDLSELVGDYLGQNWAFSRGPLSMLGFRAAELNGKTAGGRDERPLESQDDDSDADVGITPSNSSSSTVVEELQKLRQGEYESFSKWENLKIDKILDQIIRSASLGSPQSRTRPVLIHLHDIIELGMTIEGSLLISRLRALADIAWQQGLQIAILGSSSCEQHSEEYLNTIREFAANDFVITRHVQPDYVERYNTTKGNVRTQIPFHLQKADYLVENVNNITRMLRALDPESSSEVSGLSLESILTYLRSSNPKFSMLQTSILPAPEIYHLACAFKSQGKAGANSSQSGFQERFSLGRLQQWHGDNLLNEDRAEGDVFNGTPSASDDSTTMEGRATLKLNEYEKRIASGQINRENLRTTFSDVHAPPETISALKLLTSLSLVRPDAFSYGVLAQDKISGCLLYGPPGTGKTMLAKAVAKESGANMLEVSGASINDKWVGESEKLIRAVFTLAKKLTPCVVFIDEADSLLASRSMFTNRASHREHINQFLKEWDGMEETSAFIMVATNRPFDLDDAVLRRLPRKILVDLPLEDDRLAILKLQLKGEILDDSVSLDEYAKRTPYYSGSDLKNMCVAAAMAAVEEENEAAAKHKGPHPFQYPERRILQKTHFEKALKSIPASINEDMVSLKLIRKFDEEYGNRKRSATKSNMGFGFAEDKRHIKR